MMKKIPLFKKLVLPVAILVATGFLTHGQSYVPVALTGFNADVIANGSGSAAASTNNDVDGVNYAFLAADFNYNGNTPSEYLPTGGYIGTNNATSGLPYQLADYSSNNSLRLNSSESSGKLVFSVPKHAQKVFVLGTGGSGGSTGISGTYTVWFTDGTSQQFTSINFPDWYNGTPYVIGGIGRINTSNNGIESPSNNPRLYQRELDLDATNYTKQVDSVTVTATAFGGTDATLNIMAITVQTPASLSCAEPTALAASNITGTTADVSWTESGSATQWQVEYGLSGFTLGTGQQGLISTTPSTSLSPLTSGSTYAVYVRAICGPGDTSDFAGPVIIHTLCDGMPTTGTLSSSATSVCPSTAFTLSLSGNTAPGAGISYHWQTATTANGPWTDVTDTPESLSVTGQNAATYYRAYVICYGSGLSDTSNVVEVAQNAATQCYCIPSFEENYMYLSNVEFAGISNETDDWADGGYGDYTSQTGNVTPTIPATLSVDLYAWYEDFNLYAYFDWNHNGVLDDPGEVYTIVADDYGGDMSYTFNITPPMSAVPGNTRMRIALVDYYYDDGTLPCADDVYLGEVEDYTVNVATLTACSGAPTTGTVTSSDDSVCSNTAFMLTMNNGTIASGLSIHWQSSADGNSWTDITADTLQPFLNISDQDQTTYYRSYIICIASGQSDTSNIDTVFQKPFGECYCIPTYTNDCTSDDDINTFILNGENTTSIDDENTGCSGNPNNYNDITTESLDLAPGGTYSGTINSEYFSSEYCKVWIDFNDDGFFDETESVAAFGPFGTSDYAFSLSVPGDAIPGMHRMRVRLAYGQDETMDPCENYGYGETNDYMANILFHPIDSIVVTTQDNVPAEITENLGTLQMSATVYPANADQSVTWSITPGTGNASIDANGLVSAVANGTVWAKATSTSNTAMFDSLEITISNQIPPPTGIIVSTQGGAPAAITISEGSLQMTASITPVDAIQDVTWSIVPETGSASIDATGLITAMTNGTVWAKAVSVADTTLSDSLEITLSNQPVNPDSILVNTDANLPPVITTVGGTLLMNAIVYPIDADQDVTWSIVPETGNANITSGGLVTAIDDGTVWAKAVSVADPTKSDSMLITISQSTGVKQVEEAIGFKLYPNPTDYRLNILIAKPHPELAVTITDASGREVLRKRYGVNELNTPQQVSVSQLAAGAYFLSVNGSGINFSTPFIKQ